MVALEMVPEETVSTVTDLVGVKTIVGNLKGEQGNWLCNSNIASLFYVYYVTGVLKDWHSPPIHLYFPQRIGRDVLHSSLFRNC